MSKNSGFKKRNGLSRLAAIFMALLMVLSSISVSRPAAVRAADGSTGGSGNTCTLQLNLTKSLDDQSGSGKTIADYNGTFSFTIAAASPSDAPMPGSSAADATVQNDGTKIAFKPITFTKGGTYQYTITESNQNLPENIGSDPHAMTVTVVVSDDLKITSVTGLKEGETSEAAFSLDSNTSAGSGTAATPVFTSGTGTPGTDYGRKFFITDSNGSYPVICLDPNLRFGSNASYAYNAQKELSDIVPAGVNLDQLKKILYYNYPNVSRDDNAYYLQTWLDAVNAWSPDPSTDQTVHYWDGYFKDSKPSRHQVQNASGAWVWEDYIADTREDAEAYYALLTQMAVWYLLVGEDITDIDEENFNTISAYNYSLDDDKWSNPNFPTVGYNQRTDEPLWYIAKKAILDREYPEPEGEIVPFIYTAGSGTQPMVTVGLSSDSPTTTTVTATLDGGFTNTYREPVQPGTGGDYAPGKVTVSKVGKVGDVESPLAGAKLHIEDENGQIVVAQWTSTEEAQSFTLAPGTYYVVEDEAPKGYTAGAKVSFTIEEGEIHPSPTASVMNKPEAFGNAAYLQVEDLNETVEGRKPIILASDNSPSPGNTMPGYCIDYEKGSPLNGRMVVQNLDDTFLQNSGNKANSDQLLRILYVGAAGDSKGYSSPLKTLVDNGYRYPGVNTGNEQWDKDDSLKFLMQRGTQLAIWSVTNNRTPSYVATDPLPELKEYVDKLTAAAADDSIIIPANAVVKVGHSGTAGEGQPIVMAAFPTVSAPGSNETVTITNIKEETTQVKVEKVWNDTNNQDGIRPSSVEVELLANGSAMSPVQKVTLNAGNSWKHTFEGLATKNNGQAITYTVRETKTSVITGTDGKTTYAIAITGDAANGFTVTNTHTPETTQVKVEKVWNDTNNQDGIRPSSVEVELLANGSAMSPAQKVTLNAGNSWKHTFEGLATKNNGQAITYTVRETKTSVITGTDGKTTYAIAITGDAANGFTVTNTHTPETTQVKVEKVWNDTNNQDGIRPSSVEVELLANGNAMSPAKKVTLNAGNSWKHTFEELATKNNGQAITYTVRETTTGVITGTDGTGTYAIAITGDAANGFTVTNTHTPETTQVKVEKVWVDNNNQDGIRLGSVTVQLYADGVAVTGKTLVLNEANEWKGSFTGLNKKQNGADIAYTVDEMAVPNGYTKQVSDDGLTITNTHTPATTTVSGSKTWDDANDQYEVRPDSITIRLHADGVQKEIKSVSADAQGNWSWTFENLPKYKDGVEIEYTITEDAVENYSSVVSGYNVTNTYTPGKTSLSVSKVWQGDANHLGVRPASVTIKLLANGDDTGKTLTLSAQNGWSGSFTELDEYKDHELIAYTIEEVETAGYAVKISGDAKAGYTVTNTYTPVKIDVPVEKKWNDENNLDGKRPESVTVQLYADGKAVKGKTLTLNAGNDWKGSFTGLDKHQADGKTEIKYTVDETAVPAGYEKSISGTTITNTYIPVFHEVEVSKLGINGTEELEGAVLTISSTTVPGFESISWTSGKETKKVSLKEGTYTLTEVTAPDGYLKAESITFTVTAGGKVLINDAEQTGGKVVMQDDWTKVTISKTDITGGKEIGGAVLQVKDGNTVVEEWTSEEGKSHEINAKLVAGKEYTLVEITAPDGYLVAEEIKFTVNTDGKVQVVEMKDDHTKVTIKKTDITGGKEIGGAVLQVKDGNTVVEEWTSEEGKSHEINAKLVAGKEYTLVEITAPDGYLVAEEIKFTVNTDGKVQVVEMKDDYKDQTVKIRKVDLVKGQEVAGAVVEIFNAGGESLGQWISEEGKPIELALKPGAYTFKEVNAPVGYICVETVIAFTVDKDGSIAVAKVEVEPAGAVEVVDGEILLKDELKDQTVLISKTDLVSGKEIAGATIVLKDENGKEVDTWISEEGKAKELNLKPGTYTFQETNAPVGYIKVETEISFTVDKLGNITVDATTVQPAEAVEVKDGTIYLKNELKDQTVLISKTDLVSGKEIAGATIVLKDENGKEVDTWISEEGKAKELNLKPGTYTFQETNAPVGYVKVETEIVFTVDKLGNITVDMTTVQPAGAVEVKDGTIYLKNELQKHKVKVNKTNLGGQEVDGARVVIKDDQGNLKATWTSKIGKTMDLELKPGQYFLVEANAPVGYECVTTEIGFTVDKLGNISVDNVAVEPAGAVEVKDGMIILKDELTHYPVKVNKTDMGGTELEGAEIVVKDAAGKEIKSWTSKVGESMSLDLKPGDYSFQETNAPEGYECVSTEIGFRVEMDGTITVTTTEVEPAGAVEVKDGIIILKDAVKEEPTTSEEEEEEEPTEPDEEGGLLPGGEEEEDTVDAETEEPESEEVETEPEATLPPAEEEENPTVDAETFAPAPTTPAPSAPDTGDHSRMGLYLGLMGVAALAGTGLLMGTRRKKEEA